MKTNAKPDMHRIDQVGRAISRQLNEHAADLPHDITERLRVARMQALAQRKPEPIRIFVPNLATSGGPGVGNFIGTVLILENMNGGQAEQQNKEGQGRRQTAPEVQAFI